MPGTSQTRSAPLPVACILALASLLGSCGREPGPAEGGGAAASATPDLAAALAESPRWIDLHDPERAASGYNLVLLRRRTPFLMDMNGVARHTWPGVRVTGRARLLPNGHLVSITDRGRFAEHDWDGRLVWEFRSTGKRRFLHHDFAVLGNGNYLLLVTNPGAATDDLLEIDRSGKELWRWRSHEALAEDLARARYRYDRTHINSIQELPENRWFDRGHEEFRPGNILMSVRELDAIYIVARPGGEVVWRHDDGLDYQHEARMVPAGRPGAGNIVFFNNGYHNLADNRRSAIVEVNPLDHSVVWSYRSPRFFSATAGTQHVEGPVQLRRETFSLARYARQTVDLCLSVTTGPSGGTPSRCFVWETPVIRPTGRPPEPEARDEADPEVRQYQKEQLEVLGYIN